MQTRPSVVCVRKSRVKRRTIRLAIIYVAITIMLLLCEAGFLMSLLLACVILILLEFFMKLRHHR